jgi:hypothetical protein
MPKGVSKMHITNMEHYDLLTSVTTILRAENASLKRRKKLGTLSPLRNKIRSKEQEKQTIFQSEMKI